MKHWLGNLSRNKLVRILEAYSEKIKIIRYEEVNIDFIASIDEYRVGKEKFIIILCNEITEIELYIYAGEYIFSYDEENSILNIRLHDGGVLDIHDIEYQEFIEIYNKIDDIKINHKTNERVAHEYERREIIRALDLYEGERLYCNSKNIKVNISQIDSSYIFNFIDDYGINNEIEIIRHNIKIITRCLKYRGAQKIYRRIYGDNSNAFIINPFDKSKIEIISYFCDGKNIDIGEKLDKDEGYITIKVGNKLNVNFIGNEYMFDYINSYQKDKDQELMEAIEAERDWLNSMDEMGIENYYNMLEK